MRKIRATSFQKRFAGVLTRVLAVSAMTLLALTHASAVAKTLYSFQGGNDGRLPHGGLVADSAGNLYGTTQYGGGSPNCGDSSSTLSGCGTVYELVKQPNGTYKESVLYAFQGGSDGNSPWAQVTLGADGSIYGTTLTGGGITLPCPTGCGTVFKLTKGSNGAWTETILHLFLGGAVDGQGPSGNLILDAQGNLYGTTFYGVAAPCSIEGCGVVFELSPTASGPWTETILHAFTGLGDGGIPAGSLITDPSGNLYGTTQTGGNGAGTVFELSPSASGWTLSTLTAFDGTFNSTTGQTPLGGVVRDAAGDLYGTTLCGGVHTRPTGFTPCSDGFGTVFVLYPPDSGGVRLLHTIIDLKGARNAVYPDTAVIFGRDGILWGTTYLEGSPQGTGSGTTFGMVPNDDGTWGQRIVARFPGLGAGGGVSPFAGVFQDSAGNLYGTTWEGGKNGFGTVYEIPSP